MLIFRGNFFKDFSESVVMDILLILLYVVGLIAFAYLMNLLIERFYTKISTKNLGKIFFISGEKILISCTLLFCVSAYGFYSLIGDCNIQKSSGEFSALIWECSKIDLADRGNETVLSIGPLFLAIIFLSGLITRLFRKYNFVVALEITIYSIIFILTLPLVLLLAIYNASNLSDQEKKDMEIKRKARIAHEAVHGKKGHWD